MAENVTYHQQVSYCGKARCRKCREGIGHGPYWYAYRTENGRTIRTYIGKNPPPEAQAQQETTLPPDQSGVRVRTLGQFALERFNRKEWETVSDSAWQQRRVRFLLACLLSSPGRKLGREQVMDLLWPEADFETTASRLDRAVYSLRQTLEPSLSRPALSRLLLTEHDSLILAEQSQLWVDADHFEQLLAEAHNTDDPGKAEQLLDEATTLYGGDYLPDEREADWAAARRELLQRAWMGLMLELADLRINRDAFVTSIDPLDRLLAADPANEAAVQRLIYALARLDRRGEALRAYHRFADTMQRDYHIAPLPETRLLYETIQHGDSRLDNAPPFRPLLASAVTLASQRNGAAAPRQARPAQIGRSHQHPLIGREGELEALHAAIQGVAQSTRHTMTSKRMSVIEAGRNAQCLLLVGEAGIGKTRLAEELSHAAQNAGWAVAWSRVYSQESSVPYRQWTEVLRNAMAHGLWQRQEIAKNRAVYQPLCSLLPELQDLFNRNATPAPLSPEQEQLRLWEAALHLLSTISERTPLLIVLDDFHWADASSCDLFAYLVRRLRGRPIVMIGTYRDNELPSSHPLRALLTDLHREQVVTTLPIQPLSDEQIAALVAELPGALVQYIQRQAAGNPFFAEELARSLATEPDSPSTPDMPASVPLPDTISAVLELRMSRLSQPCQRLLSNASVMGGSFTFSAIAGLEASGGNASEDAVLDLLEEAIQSGVLTEEGTGTRITYHFWHPLLVSHLYDQLSAARRTRLHRRAAAILQRAYQGNEAEGAALIANHLVEGGGEPDEIIHYASLAADRAYNLSAYPEAERFYHLAVTQLDENGGAIGGGDIYDARIEQGQGQAAAPTLAYLLERLGECTRNLGNYEEARRLYQRVLDVRGGAIDRASPDPQHEAQIDALLWREIALTWYDIGDNANARQCCEHGETVLQTANVTGGPAWASIHFLQSYIYWREGNYDAARHMADEALRLYEQSPSQTSTLNSAPLTGTQRTLAGDPVNLGRTHSLIGAIANSTGHTTDSLTHFQDAITIFEQNDRPREIAITSCNIGDVHLRKAEHEAANAAFRRASHLAERMGETSSISAVLGNSGILAARTGDLLEAETWFRRGITFVEQINDQVYISQFLLYFAIMQQDQGNLDKARNNICRALLISRSINHASLIGFALVTSGMLRIMQAMQVMTSLPVKEQSLHQRIDTSKRFLKRAIASLQRALTFDELDAEIRYEGQLARAQALLLLGDRDAARQQASSVYEETNRQELIWIATRAGSLLGSILAAQGQWEQAKQHFEQAIQVFRQRDMRLELARAQCQYGMALLRREGADRGERQQGIDSLREAQQAFKKCGAALDLQMVEREIARYEKNKP